MFIEHFNDLIKELGTSVGLPDLKPGDEGLCSLRFDDKVTLDLECHEDTGALIISSVVGTLNTIVAEAFYPLLLEANLLWGGTGGATLGVDPATLSVFMCYQEKIEAMEFFRFQELLKGFSDVALYWYQRLQQSPEESGKLTEVVALPAVGAAGGNATPPPGATFA
ncbi:MAG: hypothetical protein A3F67_05985 [Verrucomicrobia bacterium RIFCSPHIGHO2_12_FULL_41_10]|nr:MAG: hypothetical protein A3F67_05985 [Verrucomicrobia bacterium RIFCSPHIGHO2_12_FULL_41_10]HLB33063.1 type III secretion system chaperone [Chthoniobacterales bacterium]